MLIITYSGSAAIFTIIITSGKLLAVLSVTVGGLQKCGQFVGQSTTFWRF
jgi:hypothetical protein